MKLGPPKRRATMRPWALVAPYGPTGLSLTTADGQRLASRSTPVHMALAGLTRHVVYVGSRLTECRRIGGDARAWEASVWRDRVVSMTHTPTGLVVRSLRGCLDQDPEPADSLEVFRGWLEDRGVGLGGVSGMARNLWRRSLATELEVDGDPEVGRSALFGGRQGIRSARTYRHQVLLDLEAAYPAMMAARPYALTHREVEPGTYLDPDLAGLVRARVHVPYGLGYGLLPERFPGDLELVAYRRGCTVSGTWAWCEVAAAVDAGAEVVRVDRCWAPATEADLYGPWWELTRDGRQLPGGAGRLAKVVHNAQWGTHAISGEAAVMRWEDPHGNRAPIVTPARARPNPYLRTVHLATETTARVRARLVTDVLADPTIPPPIHVDTDGVILRRTAGVTKLCGEGPGTWRLKRRMPVVEVRAPQVYRYLCDDKACGRHPDRTALEAVLAPRARHTVRQSDGSGAVLEPTASLWHYSVSGVPATMARAIFDKASRHRFDVALPSGWEDHRDDLTTDEVWS